MADDITVKVGFDGTQAESGLGKLRKESDSFATQLTAKLTGAFAAMTLFDKGVAFATRTFEKFADVSDKAERAGITAEDFQRIGYAAELSGTSMEAAAKAMREIRNATSDAAAGSKKATDALIQLGYTKEEIIKGDIKSTDVLLRMAQAYKAAGSDAAKFAVATSILSTRSASELIPLLGTGQGELQGAMGREVVSNDVANQMKAVADQAKQASQALEMFTVNVVSFAMRAFESAALFIEDTKGTLKEMVADAQEEADPNKSQKKMSEALAYFNDYERALRISLTGQRDAEGRLWTKERVDDAVAGEFADIFPAAIQRQRQMELSASTAVSAGVGAPPMTGNDYGVVASSLAAVGGGGGVYASDAIDLASRTANATEQIAQTMEEWLAATYGTAPVSSE